MATLQEMLKIAGSIESAEKIARGLWKSSRDEYGLDYQLALAAQGKWKEAIQVNAGLKKDNARTVYATGLLSVISGDLTRGIYEMHCGRDDSLFGNGTLLPGNLYDPRVTDLTDKVVLIRSEGGLGDEIINVRFAKTLKDRGARVIVSCSKSLQSIFADVDGVDGTVAQEDAHLVKYDYWLPGMSAPGMLGVSFDTLTSGAYLKAKPKFVEKFAEHMGEKSGLRVGIKWVGNPLFEHEQHRRFPLKLLLNAVKGHDVWSLDISQPCPEGVKDATPMLQSWDDTLGALSNIDLLITSCTSLAHAAAALGKETWVLTPIMPYYVWAYPIESNTSPWYDSVKLYRQKKFGVWDQPFAQISKDLATLNQGVFHG